MNETLKWDSANWRTLRDARLLDWMLGDHAAVSAFLTMSQISEVWDDLADGDPVGMEEINQAFAGALITLQTNPFYREHQGTILGVLIAGVNAWLDSVDLEKGNTHAERMHAFYLRNFCYELINVYAYCVGGWGHMRDVSLEMRQFFTHETYAQWEHRLC